MNCEQDEEGRSSELIHDKSGDNSGDKVSKAHQAEKIRSLRLVDAEADRPLGKKCENCINTEIQEESVGHKDNL